MIHEKPMTSSELHSPEKMVSIVVPVYNEEDALLAFHHQLVEALEPLPYHFSILYVDDGSADQTTVLLQNLTHQDPRVSFIALSRNFGHQSALTAGMDAAQGDYVITMDGDGQHPPALIAAMLNLAESGYDIVLTQREDQASGTFFKRQTSTFFYQLLNRVGDTQILPGGADFRLLSRSAADGLNQMHEYHRFLRGMVSWIGFRTVILPYTPPARLGGKSKYSFKKMLRLATSAIFSFSLMPLYVGLSLGALMLVLAVLEVFYVLSFWISGNQHSLAPGWSSLMFILLLVSGILMILLGFIGVYVGYIFQEVKRRPIYLVRQVVHGQGNPETTPAVDDGNPAASLSSHPPRSMQ